MRQSVVHLVESVRALRLGRSEHEGKSQISFGIGQAELKDRLLDLVIALESLDADGGLKASADEITAQAEAGALARFREGLGGILRWIRMQGLEEPAELVAEALGGTVQKRKSGYDMLPIFAPNGIKKRKTWKPTLNLGSLRHHGFKSLADHARAASGFQQVTTKLRAAAVITDRGDDETDSETERAQPRGR